MILADFTKSHSLSKSAKFLWLDAISRNEHIDPPGALTVPPALTLPSANGGGNSSSLIMGCCCAAAAATAAAADSLWKCGRHGRAKRQSVRPSAPRQPCSPLPPPAPAPLPPPPPPRWSVGYFGVAETLFWVSIISSLAMSLLTSRPATPTSPPAFCGLE